MEIGQMTVCVCKSQDGRSVQATIGVDLKIAQLYQRKLEQVIKLVRT